MCADTGSMSVVFIPVGVMHLKPKPTTLPLRGVKCRRRNGLTAYGAPVGVSHGNLEHSKERGYPVNPEQHPPIIDSGGQAFVGIVQQTVFHTVGISAYSNYIKGVMNYEKSVRLRKVW